jgi:hypothetical protein
MLTSELRALLSSAFSSEHQSCFDPKGYFETIR